ncbi:MAG: NADH-quinone oxidoreductase subunit NuoG [Alkalilacustris sp.]
MTKPTLILDGREVAFRPGVDLLTACIEAGVMVPHFCWHGALGSIGACRLCAVTVTENGRDRIEISCMTPATEGMQVRLHDRESENFRARVIEWLMVNHPHDCAVCEAGGACHLQDMTVATGHHARRARFPKRTHRNQDLGPLLTHEMNRCIACYRCTRFYRGYAGGRDLDVFGAHDDVYFGRAEDGVLESPFAGNLAEVCPTGVFNDKGWSKGYARPWDMMHSPSVCTGCSVGCNLTMSERHGRLRRVENRYHGAINGFFLCDRGRFGPLWVEGAARLTQPHVKGRPTAPGTALAAARELIAGGAIGIGSPRASLEANYALRCLVGPENFFAGISDAEAAQDALIAATLATHRPASLKDIETADAALVLGEDLTGHAPRAALALRQTARAAERALAEDKGVPHWLDNAVRVAGEGRRAPVTLVTPLPDALDPIALRSLRREPDAIAAFGHSVAAALRGEDAEGEATAVAAELQAAEAPVIVAGSGLGAVGTVAAAAAIAAALGDKARLALFPAEANSLGLALLAPAGGLDAAAGARGGLPVIALDTNLSGTPLAGGDTVALAALQTEASIALPVASFAEAAGTWVNHEGRAQRAFAAKPEGPPAAWRVLSALGDLWPEDAALDAVLATMAGDFPALADARAVAPGSGTKPCAARAPRRFSGRTADDRAGRVPEGTPPADPDGALAWSMEGAAQTALAVEDGLHSPSAVCLVQEQIGGPLKGGDPGVHLLRPGHAPTPAEIAPAPGEGLRVIPLHDAFAAHPADRAGPLLAERAGPEVARLHPEDAAAHGLADGATLVLGPHRLGLVHDAGIPRGHLGLPAPLARRLAQRVAPEGAA